MDSDISTVIKESSEWPDKLLSAYSPRVSNFWGKPVKQLFALSEYRVDKAVLTWDVQFPL